MAKKIIVHVHTRDAYEDVNNIINRFNNLRIPVFNGKNFNQVEDALLDAQSDSTNALRSLRKNRDK